MQSKRLSPVAITGLIIAAAAVIFGIYGVSTYNSLAKQNQEVTAQWSQVENVMQRRADLIPNLVSAVKGSMNHETEIFDNIAKARSNYNNATTTKAKATADSQLQAQTANLISVIKESYPKLSSQANVQTLMTQLEGSENRISTERQRYIEDVKAYNQSVVTFPKNIFANMMGLGQKATFKADPSASEVPKVDLNN
ncbi:LemA family protein [Lacticaseibacillus manihotivorans]|uniref:Membrane protein LemA n=2 Tax=Lacticaseibacillus manihotivorans TaxID=88233 RepID=A0A0R1QQL2_9LACO|nr:LemA family protein [Lacticaseibacillus manihotivorans]KRL44980.1 membrane protein LemA [Lacticaseibacillus manihotivorans DSM 13343 = JCM 12514]QFQ90230.1 LemA family protein [Lacticaseibacillus manihotivorans]